MTEQLDRALMPSRYAAPEKAEPAPLAFDLQLASALREAEVSHCRYPGSTPVLENIGRGRTIHLLVDATEAARFAVVMATLGCKPALARHADRFPDAESFVGSDPRGGLVHVRAHYRLYVGNSTVTHYRLPIEQPVLQSIVAGSPFPAPARGFELLILVLRTVVDRSVRRPPAAVRPEDSATTHSEVDLLACPAQRTVVHELLAHHLPCVPTSLFDACLHATQFGSSWWQRRALRRHLAQRLTAHKRRPSVTARLSYLTRRIVTLSGRLGNSSPRMRLASGGKVIALIGGDGSGKSTCARELSRWLSQMFDVESVNLAWPRRSLASLAVGGALRTSALIATLLGADASERLVWNDESSRFPGYVALLRHVCNARDRYNGYVRIRQFADDGGIVLCERYPILESQPIDGSRIRAAAVDAPNQRLAVLLRDREEEYYRQFVPPDQAIVLLVDPSVAVRRKPGESADDVRRHAQLIWQTDWAATPAYVVDAEQPLPLVLAELKVAVWSEL